jgi:glutaredoxin
LYQYAICPYCNIAKALLNYTNTPFEAKEVNPLTKAELKSLPDKEYKKVPILTVGVLEDEDDHDHDHDHDEASNQVQQVNGSEAIVDHLLSSILVAVPSTENSTIDATSPSALKWTDFARNDLAPLLYPNLCNTLSNSYQAFGYVHAAGTPFSLTQRYSIQFVGSIAMYMAASKIKSTSLL